MKQSLTKGNQFANWALITGILSPFFFSMLIPEALAFYFGYRGISRAKELNGVGKTKSVIGFILGIIYIITFFYVQGFRGR